jgi:hypothetical protein
MRDKILSLKKPTANMRIAASVAGR